jgi:alpha-1,2-mannosyltransferase
VKARILVPAALLVLIIAAFAFKASAKMADFEVYWRAGERAAAAAPLYVAEDGHYQLKYLPAFAMLAIPAAWLPLTAAKAVWFTASAILVAVLLGLSLALLPSLEKPRAFLLAATLVLLAKFYGHELILGQVNVALAAIVLLAVHAGVRGQSIASGVLIALAVVIKPYAAIMLPWCAARRDVRAAAAAAAGTAVALVLPAATYGIEGTIELYRAWWKTVSESTAPNLLNPDNVSLAAMYAKWIGIGPAAARLAAVTAGVLLLAAGVVFARRGRVAKPDGLEASLLLTLMPLLSPQGWDYVFVVSTPAVMFVLDYEHRLPAAIRILTIAALAAIGFSLYDVMGRDAYGVFMALSVVSVCYLVVITALAALRLRGAA